MVRTVRRTILRFWIECRTNFKIAEHGSDSSTNYTSFLNWLINEMKASARTSLCRLYTDSRAHAHTRRMQPIVNSRPKASAMDSTAVPRTHLFISLYLLGPTDNADPPIHKWSHFLQSERLKTFMLSAMYCCLSFFLFHTRALRFQPIRRKVRWTLRTVSRACWVKCFGPQTQLCHISLNCPN